MIDCITRAHMYAGYWDPSLKLVSSEYDIIDEL